MEEDQDAPGTLWFRGGQLKRWALGVGAALLAAIAVPQDAAWAGSDNSSNTYAGDANGIALPTGTFLAIQYLGVRESDTYVTTNDNIFAKLGAGKEIKSDFELFSSITRFVYFTTFLDRPLALEAAFTGVNLSEVNIGDQRFHDPVTGLGPQTTEDGFIDPVFFLSYGLISSPKDERFLVLTNYFYVPWGDYNKFAEANAAAPNQFTWVPQLALAEGLAKYGMKDFWLDVIANASLHTDGSAPLAIAGVGQFDELDQDNSYDLKSLPALPIHARRAHCGGPGEILGRRSDRQWRRAWCSAWADISRQGRFPQRPSADRLSAGEGSSPVERFHARLRSRRRLRGRPHSRAPGDKAVLSHRSPGE